VYTVRTQSMVYHDKRGPADLCLGTTRELIRRRFRSNFSSTLCVFSTSWTSLTRFAVSVLDFIAEKNNTDDAGWCYKSYPSHRDGMPRRYRPSVYRVRSSLIRWSLTELTVYDARITWSVYWCRRLITHANHVSLNWSRSRSCRMLKRSLHDIRAMHEIRQLVSKRE